MDSSARKIRSVLTFLIGLLFLSSFLFYKTTPTVFADCDGGNSSCAGKSVGDLCGNSWLGPNYCCAVSDTGVCNDEYQSHCAENGYCICDSVKLATVYHDPCDLPSCGTCTPPPTPTSTPVPPTPTPTEAPDCPPMNCTYSQPNGGCPTGVEIVTGTNIYGGCTYDEDCSTTACEIPGPTPTPTPPGVCNNNGDMDNGETGIDCGGGDCPPCPLPPDIPEAVCQEGVSTGGNWSDNPADWPKTVTRAPGEGVAFKVRLTATKGSMNQFYLENKFDNIIDGFTNIWQNTNRDRSGLGIWQGYPPYYYNPELPGLSFTSDWSDFGNFNTGQKTEFEWNETITSTAQSFKNTMFYKYDNPGVPPAAFKGRYDNRCWVPWPEEAPDSEDCIVFPIGCGGDWGVCPYSLYFNCNKVTVEVNPVKASITGSTNVLVGSAGSWEERYERNAQSGSISIARKDRKEFNCPGTATTTDAGDPNRSRYWCTLNPVGTSTPFSRSWTPPSITDVGDYYAVANAFANPTGAYTGISATECTGNPDCTFNGIPGDPSTGWRNCSVAWSDCGPPPSPNDRIDFTVTYPPPNASISGPATANVNQNLTYEGRLEGTARSGWITVTRDDKGVFTCPSGLVVDSTGRNWCFLAIGVSSPFSGSFTPREAGVYWVLVNAFVNQKAEYVVGKPGDNCTGNPDCTFNGGWRDCSYGWSNCGDNDNIRLTVSATCQVSGVTCGAVTPSTVTLNNISWTDSGWGATGMAVQRDIWNLFTVPFASSFTDSGLAPNTTNNYYVGCSKDLGGGATAYTGWTGPVTCTTPSPPPTCSSVSISPNSMALFVEQATGRTLTPTVNGLSNGSISNVVYSPSNTLVATVNPSFSSISPFQTTVNPNTRGSTTINTRANLSGPGGTGSCTGTSTVSVGGCSVSLSASSVTNPNPMTVSFSGRSPNSGTEPVRLWLERRDWQPIDPSWISSQGLTQEVYSGISYYELASCNSTNGSTCSGSTTLSDLPAGDYYVHCDIPNDPDKCSGNPFCNYEGGPLGCDSFGWGSCSTNDNAALAVADPASTCTGVTLSPNPMALFPEQITGRTLTPTVSGIRYGRVSSVDYSSSAPGVAGMNPASSTISPFQTTVTTPLTSRGSATVTATANLIGGAGLTGSCMGASAVSVGGCDVSLSASSILNTEPVTVTYSGRSPNLGSEPVRLWLKSQDGLIDNMLASCNSVNGTTCSGSVTISDLSAGSYYVSCDIPNDPDKCTGNPFGVPAGWESCSTTDNAALTVWGRPTCNINGPSTIYLDAPSPFSGSSTVLGGGISNMEIDRNRSQSVTGSDFAQLAPGYATCGNTSNTCAIPLATWEPEASDVGSWWVFCRGYNASSPPPSYLECRPFGLYGYPLDSLVGDCGPNGEQDIIPVTVEPPPSWFQVNGGDVHARGNLTSQISPRAEPPYFSLLQEGYPGVISAGSTDLGPLPSPVSQDPPFGWLLDDYSYDGADYFNRKPYGYEYFDKKIINPQLNPQSDPQSWDGNKKITEGDLIIDREWIVNGNKQVVVLVENNLIINKNITIQQTPGVERNFVAFIVKGDIIIDGSVSVDNLTDPPALEGVYIADLQIKTGSTGPSDKQLYARGAFIAWGGFALERTFQSINPPFEPAERFESDINLLMQAPSALLSAPVVWQEIAP